MTGGWKALAALLMLMACAAPAPVARVAQLPRGLPPVLLFGAAPAPVTRRDNVSIARDFLRLVFQLESGRRIDALSRFERPVTVRLAGRPGPATVSHDLDILLARLRDEAGIDISRAGADRPAGINVELIDKRALQQAVPKAACFVVPNVASWQEFRQRRNRPELNWSALRERTVMSVFIPADVSAQEIRDCLHEEIAQALGPVNDIYDLPDSVFNDDNFHTVLTGFDMVILRTIYDGGLQSGMTREAVVARLPAILSRLNPAGEGRAPRPLPGVTPAAWVDAVETALGASARNQGRVGAAERAVLIARNEGWRDNRLGFSLYAYGRLVVPIDTREGLRALNEAKAVLSRRVETAIHTAHVDVQLAAHAMAAGRARRALDLADGAESTVRVAQNAGLLFSLQMVRSVALASLGETEASELARREALGWARYAYAEPSEIRVQVAEIELLGHRTGEGG